MACSKTLQDNEQRRNGGSKRVSVCNCNKKKVQKVGFESLEEPTDNLNVMTKEKMSQVWADGQQALVDADVTFNISCLTALK